MSKMKKIILHGKLKELYDKPIEVEASTIAEAMRSLQFIPELQPADGQPWPVTIQGVNSEIALYAETTQEEIHVYPRLGGGGGKGGLLQILLGITLIALSFILPFAAGGLMATLGITEGMMLLSGTMMVLGGLMQMLMPVPETDSQEGSLYLGAGANTVRIGTRIPVVYGTRKIGGHYLSFDVDAKDIALEGDPNEATQGNPNYFQYDRTTVPIVPYRPIYASATASPSNIPVQA
jgi:predicted phage tail protein